MTTEMQSRLFGEDSSDHGN